MLAPGNADWIEMASLPAISETAAQYAANWESNTAWTCSGVGFVFPQDLRGPSELDLDPHVPNVW